MTKLAEGSVCGPVLPTCAVRPAVGYLGYTGRGADIVTEEAPDPKRSIRARRRAESRRGVIMRPHLPGENAAITSSSMRAPGVESWLTQTVVLAGVQLPRYSFSTATIPSWSRMSVMYFVIFTTSVKVRPS